MGARLDSEYYVVRHAEFAGFIPGPNGCGLCPDLLTDARMQLPPKYANGHTGLTWQSGKCPEDIRSVTRAWGNLGLSMHFPELCRVCKCHRWDELFTQ